MGVQVKFAGGGSVAITAASDETLDVTVDFNGRRSETYEEAWDSDVETTIDNFIASHGSDLADKYYIFAENDGGTPNKLVLWGVESLYITSENGTVASADLTAQLSFDSDSVVSFEGGSDAKTLVMKLDEAQFTESSYDLTFFDGAARKRFEDLVWPNIKRAEARNAGVMGLRPSLAHKIATSS